MSWIFFHIITKYGCAKPVIYAGFFGWGGPQNVWVGPIFRGWNEILLLGKALKFGVIFQKYALKLIKTCKIIGKVGEKCKSFGKSFKIFWPGIIFNYMKNKELIWTGFCEGFGGRRPQR